jgi:hypothetical protein
MHQNVDFSVSKLFAPIENLELDRRAFHILRRSNIRTVSQIINLGEANMLALRNLGPTLVDRVFSKIANYLGVSKENLFSDPIRKISKSQQDKVFNPLDASIAMLDLSPTTMKYLRKARIVLIKDLTMSRDNHYSNISYVGKKAIREIDRELLLYLNLNQFIEKEKQQSSANLGENVLTLSYDTPLNNTTPIVFPEEPQVLTDTNPVASNKTEDLGTILRLLGVNERAWLAVDLRANQLLTLVEISSKIGGLTRERVRQIIERVEKKVHRDIRSFFAVFDCFEKTAIKVRKGLTKKQIEKSVIISELRMNLADSNLLATDKELERLIAIVRILIINKKPWILETLEERWKTMVFLCCLVDPPIEKYEKISEFLDKQIKKLKQMPYKELAYLVLAQAKKPLHWSEIANHAYKLEKRKNFETRAIYHALLAHNDTFVRVGTGTYELVEWGSKRVESYPDIVASVLKQQNQAIPFDLILGKVSSIRSVKQPSLIMYLEMHPRFYRSINNTYGLRGWLPPREKQNLRTPEWLIEDSKSLERVERAKRKGYVIENIIVDDKLR